MSFSSVDRRRFLQAASALASVPALAEIPAPGRWSPLDTSPFEGNRVWLGPSFWANRLQDWHTANGVIESDPADPNRLLSTAALLTRTVDPAKGPAHLSARVRRIEGGAGFAGFLIGGGAGQLQHPATALVQQASGTGGGLLCVWETDGRLTFREHTDEKEPVAWDNLQPMIRRAAANPDEEAELRLTIAPRPAGGELDLTFSALDSQGKEISLVTLPSVDGKLVTGGVYLAAFAEPAADRARYSFHSIRTGGPGVIEHPDHTFGPIAGSVYSLSGNTLKLSAQLLPVGESEPREVTLEVRGSGGWRQIAQSKLESGYVAVFRVSDWDSTKDHPYRVRWNGAFHEGSIRREPDPAKTLTVGLVNCVAPVARNLDQGGIPAPLPGANIPGRYDPRSITFPFQRLTENVARHDPDLIVFAGDQIYEGRPTRTDPSPEPWLDYLYKWAMWHWAFRDLTRNRPAIVQIDDHDVYQGNIWGQGGRPAPEDNQNRGGYVRKAEWVNMVHRTQCAHNPDPYDPAPIKQGIHVYYGAFRYGGVSFAILEDRKFKTGAIPDQDISLAEAELLGQRQEAFLRAWAKDRQNPNEPKICLTQTTMACAHTAGDGASRADRDSNGYPKPARDRAISLIRDANAVILSGDQHLSHVLRHGIQTHIDGPVQFTAPAGASLFTRWLEPAHDLPNSRGPNTGHFTDYFGNTYRILAVANPAITQKVYDAHRPTRGRGLEDPDFRSDGYGIVRVDKSKKVFVLECWPAGTSTKFPADKQYAGWPIEVPFDKAGKA